MTDLGWETGVIFAAAGVLWHTGSSLDMQQTQQRGQASCQSADALGLIRAASEEKGRLKTVCTLRFDVLGSR